MHDRTINNDIRRMATTFVAVRRKPAKLHDLNKSTLTNSQVGYRSRSSSAVGTLNEKEILLRHNVGICSDTKWYADIKPSVASVASKLPRQSIPSDYCLCKSTEQNYKSQDYNFFGPFASVRKSLDYSYHSNYKRKRQNVQDQILIKLYNHSLFSSCRGDDDNQQQQEQWIVFTAGPMGAGKGYTLQRLTETKRFPLDDYLLVDLDEIRRELPEFSHYASHDPATAGDRTRKEAGYASEIATLAALRAGENVVADGSLRAYRWYREYFARLRKEFPRLRIAVFYITAPRTAILRNAADRALQTGRYVPLQTLEKVMWQVPKSMEILAPLTDYFVEFFNSPENEDIEIVGVDWKSFEQKWKHACR